MRYVDIEALKRLGLSDPDDVDEELAEVGRQLPAVIAALERAGLIENAVRKVERRLRANGFLTYADPLRDALESTP